MNKWLRFVKASATWQSPRGLSLVEQTKIITAASELARNTIIHGKGGHVVMELLQNGVRKGVRLTFEDSGPGIRRHRAGHDGWLHNK